MHGSGTTHFTVVIVVLLAPMTSAWLDDQSIYAYKKESFLSTEKCYRSKTECIMPMSSQPTSFCYFR